MKPKRLLPLLVLPSLLVSLAAGTDTAPIRTARQEALHEAADTLRAAGYEDTDPEIAVLSRAWWAEQEALDIVARLHDGASDRRGRRSGQQGQRSALPIDGAGGDLRAEAVHHGVSQRL